MFSQLLPLTKICIGIHLVDNYTNSYLKKLGGLSISKVLQGELWRPLTYPFLHVNVLHLLCNMRNFEILAPEIQEKWGLRGSATLAVLSTAVHTAAEIILSGNQDKTRGNEKIVVGLSGVLFAMMGALNTQDALDMGVSKAFKNMLPTLILNAVLVSCFEKMGTKISHLGHAAGYLTGVGFTLVASYFGLYAQSSTY